MKEHPAEIQLRSRHDTKMFTAPHYPLPTDKARFAGEAVAMVVGETVYAAKDGAERVEIDYETLPAVVETIAAARQDAPRVHETAQSNVSLDAQLGDARRPTPLSPRTAHVTRFETSGAAGDRRAHGAARRTRLLRCRGTRHHPRAAAGGAVRLKEDLATILGVPAEKVRVLMGDVGGNFGTRGMIYPEFALAAWAAKKLGRPVKWIIERPRVVSVRLSSA